MEINYNPEVHGDPLLYPQAFVEVAETKLQDPIHQMDPKQHWLWDQFYLFQESLVEIADIQGIRRDSSDEDSDSQMTMASHQTPMGSQSNLAATVSGTSGTADTAPSLETERSTEGEERLK